MLILGRIQNQVKMKKTNVNMALKLQLEDFKVFVALVLPFLTKELVTKLNLTYTYKKNGFQGNVVVVVALPMLLLYIILTNAM